ncbi:3-hydroxyacyl-ACP dehydratase FabZ family protein [Acidisarcina polymorpha]|uniref:3-hydroxyacyl-ACP dehydratase FabZ family protein n=1 Tax=Acidisarcina polymorpha TaxID=2211140 RepID=UPI000DEEDF43|nr:3-hydroxyacyl-ACP dehydratase FabZ family protein [Acidisarcina polymorpha]
MVDKSTQADRDELLALLPQTVPFRFVDQILEIDDQHVCATYQFRGDEYFYTGHFQGDPVTPGVILLEAMAQGGVVVQALYLMRKVLDASQVVKLRTVLTDVQGEFYRPVLPPEGVIIRSEVVLWRARKIRCHIKMFNQNLDLVATATIGGMGVSIA